MPTFKIEKAKLAFCSVTKPEGHSNGKHLLGVYVDKKFKKEFIKNFDEIWEENKTTKVKKPVYSAEEWFSEDDNGKLIFWLNKDAGSEYQIKLSQGEDCSFTRKDFERIGAGSIANVSYDLYYHNHKKYGEMVLRSIKAISLLELVPYEDDGGVGGKSLDNDENYKDFEKSEDDLPKKEKKSKKNKKSKDADDEDEPAEKPKKDKKKKKKKE